MSKNCSRMLLRKVRCSFDDNFAEVRIMTVPIKVCFPASVGIMLKVASRSLANSLFKKTSIVPPASFPFSSNVIPAVFVLSTLS